MEQKSSKKKSVLQAKNQLHSVVSGRHRHHEPGYQDVAQWYVSFWLHRPKHLSTVIFLAPREGKGDEWIKRRAFLSWSFILIFFLSYICCNNDFWVSGFLSSEPLLLRKWLSSGEWLSMWGISGSSYVVDTGLVCRGVMLFSVHTLWTSNKSI